MKAVVLAGGRGSRLRPLTDKLPKPMVELCGMPVMEYTVRNLVRGGITDIAVTLCYKPRVITDYFGDGAKWGANITYFYEDEPLGTAGGVKAASGFFDGDFVVASADTFTDIDYGEFARAHASGGAPVTVAVRRVKDVSRFGVVHLDGDGTITRFEEKPQKSDSDLVSMGIYCIGQGVMDLVPEGVKYDFAKDLFPRLVGKMKAYRTSCYWSDIGTLESYAECREYGARALAAGGSLAFGLR